MPVMSVQLRDGVETTTRQYTRTIPGLRTSLLIQRLAFYKCSFCLVPGQCNISSAWGPQKYCESTEDEAARTAEYGASTEYYDRTENNAESTQNTALQWWWIMIWMWLSTNRVRHQLRYKRKGWHNEHSKTEFLFWLYILGVFCRALFHCIWVRPFHSSFAT